MSPDPEALAAWRERQQEEADDWGIGAEGDEGEEEVTTMEHYWVKADRDTANRDTLSTESREAAFARAESLSRKHGSAKVERVTDDGVRVVSVWRRGYVCWGERA